MEFKEFIEKIYPIAEVPQKLEFKPAMLWPIREWLPARITSLGEVVGAKVMLPDKSKTSWSKETRVVGTSSRLFANKTHITDIILPNSIGRLPEELFAGCTNLKRVTIPRGVNCILRGAFEDCNSLEDIYYEGTEEEWHNINIIHEAHRIKEPLRLGLYCDLETYIIPGNEPIFKAKIHYNCAIGESSTAKFTITIGNKDVTSVFEFKD